MATLRLLIGLLLAALLAAQTPAMRLATGQILDEFRVVGDNRETWYVTSTVRYNAGLDRCKPWSKEIQKTEAHRIGPARSLDSLAPAR
jgi:hypothetical protein